MEQILNRILEKLDSMESELKNVNNRLDNLEQGQQDIKRELRFIWDDIKRLDKRLSKQEEETFILKRMR